MQGSIRFVAQYLQDHLPQHEEMADSEEEQEETDEVWAWIILKDYNFNLL